MSSKRLLIVVASESGAAPLAQAFLRDTLSAGLHPQTRADIWLVNANAAILSPLPPRVQLVESGNNEDLGTVALFVRGFAAGYGTVCVVGVATPHLPPALIQEAFGRLEASAVTGTGADAVWMPTDAGGCCLIGLRPPLPTLLSTENKGISPAAGELLQRAQAIGLAYHLLPRWYAVQTAGEERQLRRDLLRGVAQAPETAKFFSGQPL